MIWLTLDHRPTVVQDFEGVWVGTFKYPEIASNVVTTHNATESQNAQTGVAEPPKKKEIRWTSKPKW